MKKLSLLCTLLFALATTAFAAKVEKTVKITVGETQRSYLLYVPATVKATEPTPLVFSLHGTGGHSADKSPFKSTVADSKGCIVVYPQGSDIYFPVFGGTLPGWNSIGETSVDIDFFKAIIEELQKTYTIDTERIYCCGFSNGGMMTYTVANVASDIFAAFASISGFPLNEFHLHHTSARPVPFLHIHGKADDFVKYSLMPSIVDNMVARNGAIPVPTKKTVSGKYTKSVYEATDGGFPYTYYEIDGMGHNDYTSNTEDGNSALTMWKFFSQYTLSTPCDNTLKWRPNLETEGYAPKTHGWTAVNSASYALWFGKEQKTDANQNVYRSLQFETGKYKICFKAESETAKTTTIKIQKLTGAKTVVLNQEVNVGEDITLFFEVTDGWGEYRFSASRNSSETINFKNLAIYSATDEEATAITTPSQKKPTCSKNIYNLNGICMDNLQRGINIVDGQKVMK